METPRILPADPWQWVDLCRDDVLLLMQSADTGPTAPIFQYTAVLDCNKERAAIENGNGFAVLACVRICGTHGLVMPDWLVTAFNRRYDAVRDCRIATNSWDDAQAFGVPYPDSSQLGRLRQRRTERVPAWLSVVEGVENEEKMDDDLLKKVGSPQNFGATKANAIYREAINLLGLYDPIKDVRKRKEVTQQELSSMKLSAAAIIARESGSDRILLDGGLWVSYPNSGPVREPSSGLLERNPKVAKKKRTKKNSTKSSEFELSKCWPRL